MWNESTHVLCKYNVQNKVNENKVNENKVNENKVNENKVNENKVLSYCEALKYMQNIYYQLPVGNMFQKSLFMVRSRKIAFLCPIESSDAFCLI